jgi:nitroimidazol reductase NimA-like FMN-containing flavoprotein (pyridoxamine 5'-phosphate oxidase superfamily)
VGVNQRALIRMTPEEQQAFLEEGRTMTLATLSPDQTIQLVAMFYGFLEGSVSFLTKAKSQKVKNLRTDPRMTCLLEMGEEYQELRGLSLVGRAEIVDEPERIWELGLYMHRKTRGPYDEARDRRQVEQAVYNRVALKLHVDKAVSWDHSKVELPPWRQ